ncbi:MAG TPA: DNRLRE domain-containing protein [Planctomycetota bacterium]|nr:DNRLRE domain-containing protein [Planctomycetota bacterium]
MPFTFENPDFGKPVPELPATAELRKQHPQATVVELWQGAPLPQLGIASYDGARDVYFGDGRPEKSFGGSCTNSGTDLSYGDDLRYQLHLGGEGRRTLVAFDLSMLPRDTRLAKALLALNVEELDRKADRNYRVVALKRRWSEAVVGVMGGLNATNSPNPVGDTENWEQPLYAGPSDRQPEPVDLITIEKTGWFALDLTAPARKWLSGEWPNCGIAIEPVAGNWVMGKHDVRMTASDHPVDPALRPRLVLVLDGAPQPAPHQVREQSADLTAAFRQARESGRMILCHVLAASSLTSRRFEAMLSATPAISELARRDFLEVHLDAERPEHAPFLKAHGVRRFPTTLFVSPRDPDGQHLALIEPFDYDAPAGLLRSAYEFEQLYSRALRDAVNHIRR